MVGQFLPQVGLTLPTDFDAASYQAIHSRVTSARRFRRDTMDQFLGAWNGVAYRFLACSEHDETFTISIRTHGDAPPQPERYIQERDLFGFFVTGWAVIDSLCYGLFAVASLRYLKSFPVQTVKAKKRITQEETTRKFKLHFPQESTTTILTRLPKTKEYKEWQRIRNILAHRTAPGRTHYLSTRPSGPASRWKIGLGKAGVVIDDNTTASRRAWLVTATNMLLEASEEFVNNHYP